MKRKRKSDSGDEGLMWLFFIASVVGVLVAVYIISTQVSVELG